jgi:hypothetical protein
MTAHRSVPRCDPLARGDDRSEIMIKAERRESDRHHDLPQLLSTPVSTMRKTVKSLTSRLVRTSEPGRPPNRRFIRIGKTSQHFSIRKETTSSAHRLNTTDKSKSIVSSEHPFC